MPGKFNPSSEWTSAIKTAAVTAYKQSGLQAKVNSTVDNVKNYFQKDDNYSSWASDASNASGTYSAAYGSDAANDYYATNGSGVTPASNWQFSGNLSGSSGNLTLNNMGIQGLSGCMSFDYNVNPTFNGLSLSNVTTTFQNPKIQLSYKHTTSHGASYNIDLSATGNLSYSIDFHGDSQFQYNGTTLNASGGVRKNNWEIEAEIQAEINAKKSNMLTASLTFRANINNLFRR